MRAIVSDGKSHSLATATARVSKCERDDSKRVSTSLWQHEDEGEGEMRTRVRAKRGWRWQHNGQSEDEGG